MVSLRVLTTRGLSTRWVVLLLSLTWEARPWARAVTRCCVVCASVDLLLTRVKREGSVTMVISAIPHFDLCHTLMDASLSSQPALHSHFSADLCSI